MLDSVLELDKKAGEIVFKNKSYFSGTIAARSNLAISRYFSDVSKTIDGQGKGLVDLDKEVEQDRIASMEEKFEELIQDNEVREAEAEGQVKTYYYSTLVHDEFKQNFPEVEDILLEFKEEIESFYGSHFQPEYINLMRYPEIDEADYFSRSWHLDEYSPDHIRLFVMLSDTEKNKGSSCFISREDTKKAVSNVEGNFKHDDEFWSKFEHNHFYGKKGSVAIASPTTNFHRGTNPDGKRDILIITLRPSVKELDQDWMSSADLIKERDELMMYSSFIKSLKDLMR